MKKFIGYILSFGVVFYLLLHIISVASFWTLRRSAFYKPPFLVNEVKVSDFDYIILGASTGLTTLNTHIIDSITGKQGINLAIDDTGLSNHYLMLQHFLANGKITRYCVLNTSLEAFDRQHNFLGDNDYRFLMYRDKDYVFNYYNSLAPKEGFNVLRYSKWTPFLGLSYYNTELFFPALSSVFYPHKRNRFDSLGNYTYSNVTGTPALKNKTEKEIRFKNPYLKKIETLCKQNNIELIYYFSPDKTRNVKCFSSSRNVINHTDVFKEVPYFYDAIHVVRKGNREASKLFANELIKLYLIEE
ncbi:hypothetical protein [Snuella lapsa]|uniref:Uncharacterized protein n=1 Tax=Snuella lapsa TaxID=870481 RepID=A0ABP6XU10_9FLAO